MMISNASEASGRRHNFMYLKFFTQPFSELGVLSGLWEIVQWT